MAPPNTWFTFRADDIWMGEFSLPPADAAWERTNQISERAPLIAIPRTAVRIAQEGRAEVVSDPTRAVLYAAGQPYQRGVVSGEGDRCSFLTFSHRLAAEAATGFDPAAGDPATYRFPFVVAPIDGGAYDLAQRARRHAAGPDVDPDALRENLYWLVARIVANGYRDWKGRRLSRPQSAAASRMQAEAVDGVRAAIGRDLSARLTLDRLAAAVHLSPFHLSRVFREHTGQSIHAYRTAVRLRASLGRISDGEALADVALIVGFASQAHLTDRFRRAFGQTPDAWRKNSRNVKATGGAARVA